MPEFTPRKSAFAKRQKTVRINERLARRLEIIAARDYEGNESAVFEGLLLYDYMVEVQMAKIGRKHDHWISAPIVLRDGELEPLLDRLESGDSDEIKTFIDVTIEKREKQKQDTPKLPGL